MVVTKKIKLLYLKIELLLLISTSIDWWRRYSAYTIYCLQQVVGSWPCYFWDFDHHRSDFIIVSGSQCIFLLLTAMYSGCINEICQKYNTTIFDNYLIDLKYEWILFAFMMTIVSLDDDELVNILKRLGL